MSIKKIVAAAIIFSTCSICFAKFIVSDPLKINIPIAPSVINSSQSASLDLSSLTPGISYQTTCYVKTHVSNDPAWFILPLGWEGQGISKISVDGILSQRSNEALISTPGNHIVQFNVSTYAKGCTGPGCKCEDPYCNISIYNASDDVFNFTNCVAELG